MTCLESLRCGNRVTLLNLYLIHGVTTQGHYERVRHRGFYRQIRFCDWKGHGDRRNELLKHNPLSSCAEHGPCFSKGVVFIVWFVVHDDLDKPMNSTLSFFREREGEGKKKKNLFDIMLRL